MTQPELFHETLNDALQAAVAALGGPKAVGAKMRPELPVDQAAGWVRDCVNPSRRESFHPEHLQMLLRECREVGYHGLAAFMMRDASYQDPVPVEVQDQLQKLQQQFVDAVGSIDTIKKQMERLMNMQQGASLTRVA